MLITSICPLVSHILLAFSERDFQLSTIPQFLPFAPLQTILKVAFQLSTLETSSTEDASQERRLLSQRQETHQRPPPPPPTSSQRRRRKFLQKTSLQSCLLGSRALRPEKMLRQTTHALRPDARAGDRAEVPRGGHIVSQAWNSVCLAAAYTESKAQREEGRLTRR